MSLEAELLNFQRKAKDAVGLAFAAKIGLPGTPLDANSKLFKDLMGVLTAHPTDYTIFFRILSDVPPPTAALFRRSFYNPDEPVASDDDAAPGAGAGKTDGGDAAAAATAAAATAIAAKPSTLGGDDTVATDFEGRAELESRLTAWLTDWHAALAERYRPTLRDGEDDAVWRTRLAAEMKRTNPRFVPREWMLAAAYKAATEDRDNGLVHELQTLFRQPFADGDLGGLGAKYDRRSYVPALFAGGLGQMS